MKILRKLLVFCVILSSVASLFAGTMTAQWSWILDDPEVTAYRYQLDGEESDGWTVLDGDTDSVTIEGLDAEKEYTLYLQRSYDGVNWSPSAACTVKAS